MKQKTKNFLWRLVIYPLMIIPLIIWGTIAEIKKFEDYVFNGGELK